MTVEKTIFVLFFKIIVFSMNLPRLHLLHFLRRSHCRHRLKFAEFHADEVVPLSGERRVGHN